MVAGAREPSQKLPAAGPYEVKISFLCRRRFTGETIANANGSVPYTYAATVLFLCFGFETGFSTTTVSVHGGDWRYESTAVIAGMPSWWPIARHESPSSSRSRTTSSRLKTRLGLPTTFPAA